MMQMILNPADNLGHAVHAFDDPAEVRMKTWLPIDFDKGCRSLVEKTR